MIREKFWGDVFADKKRDKCFGVYKTAGEKQEAEVIANTPPTAQLR